VGFGADLTATALDKDEIGQLVNDIYLSYTKITRGYFL